MKHVKLSDFTPDPKNANKGTERGRAMLTNSLKQLGAGRSILVDKNNVAIAGNKTLHEAVEAGMAGAIVVESDGTRLIVVRRTDLDLSTDEKAKQLAIADNRVGQISLEWDADVLAELSQEVDLSGFFTTDELASFLPTVEPPSPEEDEATTADLMEQAEAGAIESRVKLGEVWSCGRHKIACADSTDEGNVRKLLGDRLGDVGMVWADPPYGIKAASSYADGKVHGGMVCARASFADIAGDDSINAAINASKICLSSLPKAIQFWWGANHYAQHLPSSSCWVVWDKENPGVAFADAELAWSNQKLAVRIFKHQWMGIWKDSEKGQKRVHPTQKPIALCEWCFEKYGKPNDIIFDPFLGSAPSIIAAQKMEGDRTVYGFELSEAYCEVVLRRFESFTGVNAELVGHL